MRRRWIIWLVASIVALVLAFALDASVATAVHDYGWDQKNAGAIKTLREIIKLFGFFPTTVALSAIVGFVHRLKWRAAGFFLLASIPAALNEPIKFIAGRLRPFKAPNMHADQWSAFAEPFRFQPFIHSNNRSFPSGHAALAFATATAFSILFPRGRAWFFAGATIVGLERITENAHWCSDVTAAALLGIGGAKLVAYWCARGNGLLIEHKSHGFPI